MAARKESPIGKVQRMPPVTGLARSERSLAGSDRMRRTRSAKRISAIPSVTCQRGADQPSNALVSAEKARNRPDSAGGTLKGE